MREHNVISTKDIMLCMDIQALSPMLQMGRAHGHFQGFHNGNMKGGPKGEGRLDLNSQIFFSVCTCPLCIADSTSEDLKSEMKGGILVGECKNLINFSTCVYVIKRHKIMICQEAMVGYHCNENLLCAIGYDL